MTAKKNEVVVRYIATPIEPLLTSVRFLPNYIELISSVSNTLICIFRLLPYRSKNIHHYDPILLLFRYKQLTIN